MLTFEDKILVTAIESRVRALPGASDRSASVQLIAERGYYRAAVPADPYSPTLAHYGSTAREALVGLLQSTRKLERAAKMYNRPSV